MAHIAGGAQTEGLESDSEAVTEARRAVMGLLLHGDAAFAGQGVVAETLQLANTPGATSNRTPATLQQHLALVCDLFAESRSVPCIISRRS